MSARAAVLNDPEVAQLLKTRFVSYSRDNAVNTQCTEAEKEWLQSRCKDLGGGTGQIYMFTAGGKVLPVGLSTRDPRVLVKGLNDALNKYQPEESPQIAKPDAEELARLIRRPFEGGLVLFATYTVLEWKEPPDPAKVSDFRLHLEKTIPACPGVERVWARKDEADALVAGQFPEKLKQRLARHVAYGMAAPSKVKAVDLTFHAGRLSGSFLFEDGARADALGFVETKEGKISRFEVMVKGIGNGGVNLCGGLGPLSILPNGKKAPVAIGFMLADPETALGRVPPQVGRDLDRPVIKGRY